jgi:RNA polymerase sigma-70 factor, ECF subfamily
MRMQSAEVRTEESDEALMLAWQAGDATAFDRLYERHRGGTFRYLLRQCGNRATAEELHQDLWLRLIGARASFDAQSRFTTWAYAVARNRLIDHWRSHAPQRLVSLDETDADGVAPIQLEDESPRANPVRGASSLQQGELLLAALEALPAAQRDAFLLHVEGGLALDEIASLADVPSETVKSRLRYAYARLRAALGDLQ